MKNKMNNEQFVSVVQIGGKSSQCKWNGKVLCLKLIKEENEIICEIIPRGDISKQVI